MSWIEYPTFLCGNIRYTPELTKNYPKIINFEILMLILVGFNKESFLIIGTKNSVSTQSIGGLD
jgi:hypothetical protein